MNNTDRENLLNDRVEELKRITGLALSREECRIFVNSCLPPSEKEEPKEQASEQNDERKRVEEIICTSTILACKHKGYDTCMKCCYNAKNNIPVDETGKPNPNGYFVKQSSQHKVEMPGKDEIEKELNSYCKKLTNPLTDQEDFRVEVAWKYCADWVIEWINSKNK